MSGGVTVAVTAMERPSWKFVFRLMQLRTPVGMKGWSFQYVEHLAVDIARNKLVMDFLNRDDEWLLMIDQDALLHPETLRRLVSWNQPIVGALAFTKNPPVVPTIFSGEDPTKPGNFMIRIDETREWIKRFPELATCEPVVLDPRPKDALCQVDFTGCHCLLIHREVLEKVPAPWFEGTGWTHHREDYYFCRKAIEHGYQLLVDRSVVAGHMYGDKSLGCLDFLAWDAVGIWTQENASLLDGN